MADYSEDAHAVLAAIAIEPAEDVDDEVRGRAELLSSIHLLWCELVSSRTNCDHAGDWNR